MNVLVEGYLTPEELAARYKIAQRTLANWRVMGRGPKYLKAGYVILYPIHEVEEWERKNMKRSTA